MRSRNGEREEVGDGGVGGGVVRVDEGGGSRKQPEVVQDMGLDTRAASTTIKTQHPSLPIHRLLQLPCKASLILPPFDLPFYSSFILRFYIQIHHQEEISSRFFQVLDKDNLKAVKLVCFETL